LLTPPLNCLEFEGEMVFVESEDELFEHAQTLSKMRLDAVLVTRSEKRPCRCFKTKLSFTCTSAKEGLLTFTGAGDTVISDPCMLALQFGFAAGESLQFANHEPVSSWAN